MSEDKIVIEIDRTVIDDLKRDQPLCWQEELAEILMEEAMKQYSSETTAASNCFWNATSQSNERNDVSNADLDAIADAEDFNIAQNANAVSLASVIKKAVE